MAEEKSEKDVEKQEAPKPEAEEKKSAAGTEKAEAKEAPKPEAEEKKSATGTEKAEAKEAPKPEAEEKKSTAGTEKAKAKEAPAPKGESAPSKEEGEQAPEPAKRSRAKGSKNISVGIVFIRATFNNTMVTITDMKGAVISWSTSGRCGFKGSRKSTAFAATMVAQEAARGAVWHGMNEVEIRVQGPGAGRESAIRALQSAGLSITSIRDITPIPHNGCRPPKRRRV